MEAKAQVTPFGRSARRRSGWAAAGHRRRGLAPVVLVLGMVALALSGCAGKDPLRLGFVSQLTGIQAELGVQERNGAQLAVEEINAAGGVAGRTIELNAQDDLGTPDGAKAADQRLVRSGVVAIIGHATSGQTLAGLETTQPAQVVMLSPTTSTPALSGKDDYFFRIVQSMDAQARNSAQHIFLKRGVDKIAVIYDTDNEAYSTAYLQAFLGEYRLRGGTVTGEVHFSSKSQPDFAPLVSRLRTGEPDGLMIVAADIDTALIAQRVRLQGWTIPLFTTSWAQTETLINNGGRAVEGLQLELISALGVRTPEYLRFVTRYQARFKLVPSFGAVLSYEATQALATALRTTGGEAAGLPKALVGIKNFKGLSDTFSIDAYGDAVRPIHLGIIRDGAFVGIKP